MQKSVVRIEGMACDHCVAAVQGAVGALQGVAEVSVDLPGKKATVVYDAAKTTLSDIWAAIEDQGYDVVRAAE